MSETSTEKPEQDQRLRHTLQELTRLARLESTPEEFYSAFLTHLTGACGALAGAIWLREGGGAMTLKGQHKFNGTGVELGTPAWDRHSRLLMHVLTTRRGGIVPPQSGMSEQTDSPANPTDFYLSLAPFALSRDYFGVLELVHPREEDADEQTEQLKLLHKAAEVLVDYQRGLEMRRMAARQQLLAKLDGFTESVHAELKIRPVAFTIANDGRNLIGADRVSVALRRGRRTEIEAISGQDHVDKRANLIRTLSRLTDAVILAGETLVYTRGGEEFPPRIERLLQEYLEESGTKAILILPMHAPGADKKTPAQKKKKARPFGALIVEQLSDSSQMAGLMERAEVVRRHSAVALFNALRHQRIFLLPLLEWLGGRSEGARGNRWVKFFVILAALGAIGAALTLVPYEFRLEGEGRLLPEVRRNIFAGEDGIVRDVKVKHGGRVAAGDVLAVLENVDLAVQLQEAKTTLVQVQADYDIKNAQRGDRGLTSVEQIQISGQMLSLRGKVDSLKREIELLTTRLSRLTVKAPMDGVITTWDVDRILADRPVQRGHVLLTEADDKQDWILEVRMPEDRIGHILRARATMKEGERLPVEFILATQPEKRYRGWVKAIGERTEFMKDASVVLVTVELDPKNLPPLRPAADVRARVECGQQPIGYVWFHELFEFVYARILFLF